MSVVSQPSTVLPSQQPSPQPQRETFAVPNLPVRAAKPRTSVLSREPDPARSPAADRIAIAALVQLEEAPSPGTQCFQDVLFGEMEASVSVLRRNTDAIQTRLAVLGPVMNRESPKTAEEEVFLKEEMAQCQKRVGELRGLASLIERSISLFELFSSR
jgi:hypothetical protein